MTSLPTSPCSPALGLALLSALALVPADAPQGVLLDAHVEFAGAGRRGLPRVFKRDDVLRVVE